MSGAWKLPAVQEGSGVTPAKTKPICPRGGKLNPVKKDQQ